MTKPHMFDLVLKNTTAATQKRTQPLEFRITAGLEANCPPKQVQEVQLLSALAFLWEVCAASVIQSICCW